VLLVGGSLSGSRLEEGSPPCPVVVSQDDLTKYANDWRKVRALVFDTSGKRYLFEQGQLEAILGRG
jgi:hypothetical protein